MVLCVYLGTEFLVALARRFEVVLADLIARIQGWSSLSNEVVSSMYRAARLYAELGKLGLMDNFDEELMHSFLH